MSAATIVLEDVDGVVALKVTFGAGFDPTSHAHQHAQILIRMMDQVCQRQGEPEVVTTEDKPPIVVGG